MRNVLVRSGGKWARIEWSDIMPGRKGERRPLPSQLVWVATHIYDLDTLEYTKDRHNVDPMVLLSELASYGPDGPPLADPILVNVVGNNNIVALSVTRGWACEETGFEIMY